MISAVISFILRVVLTLAGIVFVLSLMAVALLTMVFFIAFSLIRGRKPKIDVSGFARARGSFNARGFNPGARTKKPVGEVVDIEAREVPETAPRIE